MKTNIKNILVSPEASILDTVKAIDEGSMQIALVVDTDGRLMGTVTDGDVRRGVLKGISFDQPSAKIMNANAISVAASEGREGALGLMRSLSIHQIPVVDEAGRVVGIEWIDELFQPGEDDTWVVLMVGGLGKRLRPLTEDIPKPMIPVGGRPLLETIIRSFTAQGYKRFFLSVNYKSDMIRNHFGDGSRIDARIEYIEEQTQMGTAGALGLLPERPPAPMIVMNGDLLTSVNYRSLMQFHRDHDAKATMCAREYSFQVPYGVLDTDGHRLTGIVEKPVQSFFVNGGIYVIAPDALDLIPTDSSFDMPQLFEAVIAEGSEAVVFPIREYWLDIGRFDDLEQARIEYEQVFVR